MQSYAPLAQEPMGRFGAWWCAPQATRSRRRRRSSGRFIQIDKDLPVFRVRINGSTAGQFALAQRRLTLTLLVSLAVLALLLASVGIYGVISYSVRQRTHELGIRMALGAQTRDVLKLILSQGLKLALLGIGIGLLLAFALTRWMETLLFDVRPTDPLTFAIIAVGVDAGGLAGLLRFRRGGRRR